MDQSTFNHGKSGDTNPKGRSRSPLLELYTRSLRNEKKEKIGRRTSAACGGRLRLCYTLDEGKESERETTNCPPKRVRSIARLRPKPSSRETFRDGSSLLISQQPVRQSVGSSVRPETRTDFAFQHLSTGVAPFYTNLLATPNGDRQVHQASAPLPGVGAPSYPRGNAALTNAGYLRPAVPITDGMVMPTPMRGPSGADLGTDFTSGSPGSFAKVSKSPRILSSTRSANSNRIHQKPFSASSL